MATQRQVDLAEAIVANKNLPRKQRENKKELLVSIGYSEKTAGAIAKDVIEAKGVQETLASFGLTEGLITKALVSDIKKKPRNRIRELNLGAEILKMKDPDSGKGNNKTIIFLPLELLNKHAITPSTEPDSTM